MARRLLFISNGIGEDSVGAEIIRRLPRSLDAHAYPTLGTGRAYEGVCPIVGPRAHLASEGSRVRKGTLAADIAGGGLATIPPGLAFLRRVPAEYDHVVVIGDFMGVLGCWLTGIRGITYLDVYKTGYGRPYSFLERWIIGATCRTVFNRSDRLARSLKAAGVDARAAGNVMMDTITYAGYDAKSRRRHRRAVALLPGSREQTAENFSWQVKAVRSVAEELDFDVFLALAGGIEPQELAVAAGLTWSEDQGTISGQGIIIHAARGATGDIIEASDLVLSQAGTATIQALGLGRPVITFARRTDRMKRYLEENRLFGDARLIVRDDPEALGDVVFELLEEDEERERLGKIGAERIGGPGAIAEIIRALR